MNSRIISSEEAVDYTVGIKSLGNFILEKLAKGGNKVVLVSLFHYQ
jgi:hypothetical protein